MANNLNKWVAVLFISLIIIGCNDKIQKSDHYNHNRLNVASFDNDSIGVFTAKLFGQITNSDNNAKEYKAGFEYCINKLFSDIGTNRVYADSVDQDMSFFATIHDCLPNQKYYYRPFLKCDSVATYGDIASFKTRNIEIITGTIDTFSLAVRTTTNAERFTTHKIEYGICYSSYEEPTINNNVILTDSSNIIKFQKMPFGALYYRSVVVVNNALVYYGNTLCINDSVYTSDLDSTSMTITSSYYTSRPYNEVALGVCYSNTSNPTINDYKTDVVKFHKGDNTTHTFFICPQEGETIHYRTFVMIDDTILYDKEKVYCSRLDNYSVDLGLSVNWAICNLGATNINNDGNYYRWGETIPFDNNVPYKWSNGTVYNKYYESDGKKRLDIEDDAANTYLGNEWRLPTKEEFEELISNCTIALSSNFSMYKVSSNIEGYEDRYIMIPRSGYYSDWGWQSDRIIYWSSSMDDNYNPFSWHLFEVYTNYRNYALPIRPVTLSKTWKIRSIAFGNSSVKLREEEVFDMKLTIYGNNGAKYDNYFDSIQWISEQPEIATVSEYGIVRGKKPGVTTITASYKDISASCFVEIQEHKPVCEAVDLGLSVKWGTCNIGAEKPEQNGGYYAWGETESKDYYLGPTINTVREQKIL